MNPDAAPPPPRLPIWLYPNLLALDAPIVAVVWQGFLARVFSVPLPLAAQSGLFVAVWLVYLVDRLLDARRLGAEAADRHRFAARHFRWLTVLAVVVFAVGVVSAAVLPVQYLLVGLAVVVVVVAYLGAVHFMPAGWVRHGAKELLVGVVFALGVGLPLFVVLPQGQWWAALLAFGLLCWWNCRLIDRWEVQPSAGRTVGRLIGMAAVVVSAFSSWPVVVVTAATAGLLLAVDLMVPRIGVRAARVLADAVLLTPLAVWAFA